MKKLAVSLTLLATVLFSCTKEPIATHKLYLGRVNCLDSASMNQQATFVHTGTDESYAISGSRVWIQAPCIQGNDSSYHCPTTTVMLRVELLNCVDESSTCYYPIMIVCPNPTEFIVP